MQKTIIVIPTYNESENLPRLITELFNLPVSGLNILVVDDNSPDGTGNLADKIAASDRRVSVLHRPGKQGLGTAYVQGFKQAIQSGADIIIQMDADFSHAPKYILEMLDKLEQEPVDAVFGSRYVKGGKLDERWSFLRKLLSWWANVVWVNVVLRPPIKDATGGYRAWRRATLIGMNLDRVRSNGYIFQVEMMHIASKLGYTFREIPIYFEDRHYGKSKMGLRITIEAALRVFQVGWRHRELTPSMRVPNPKGKT
jgi:dolichol-phosphate mannosyltransferase